MLKVGRSAVAEVGTAEVSSRRDGCGDKVAG